MNDGFAVNTTGMDMLFDELEELGTKTTPMLLRERTGLFARLLASYTQPVASAAGGSLEGGDANGLSPQARNLGKSAVVRDIGRVYMSVNAVFGEIDMKVGNSVAKSFRKLATAEPESANAIIREAGLNASNLRIVQWDGGQRHRQMRNKRGRVSTGTKPGVILDVRSLTLYRKEKENMVGFAKSTWVNAAQMVPDAKGLGRIPAWIRKQQGPGRGVDRTRAGDNPHVTLQSNIVWMQDAFSARTDNMIMQHFEKLIIKDLENAISYLREKQARRSSSQLAMAA